MSGKIRLRQVTFWSTLLMSFVLCWSGCSKKKEDKGETKAGKETPAAEARGKAAAPVTPAPAPPPVGPAPVKMAAPADKAHEVVLNRPIKVGQKFHWKSAGTADSRLTADGNVVPHKTSRFTFVFESEVEVLKVNKIGVPQKVTHKVISLKVTEKGKTTSPLAAGTLVTAEDPNEGKTTYLVGDKPAEGKIKEVLSTAIMVDDDNELNTGEVFGPKGPKKVGDTWTADVDKLLASLKSVFKNPQMWPKPGDVKTKVKLAGLYKVDGVMCMKVKGMAKLNNVAPTMGPVKATAGKMRMAFTSMLPLDKTLPGVAVNYKMVFHVEGEVDQGGKKVKIVLDMLRHINVATKAK